jgi:hypothetical protein
MKRKEVNIQTGEETIIDLTAEEVAAKEAREVVVKKIRDDEATAKTTKETNQASGKQKLKDLGLNDDEIKALTGA